MAIVKIGKVRMAVDEMRRILQAKPPHFGPGAVESDAPADLVVLGVEQPPYAIGQWFYVLVESKEFRPIPAGAEIPEIEIIFRREGTQ